MHVARCATRMLVEPRDKPAARTANGPKCQGRGEFECGGMARVKLRPVRASGGRGFRTAVGLTRTSGASLTELATFRTALSLNRINVSATLDEPLDLSNHARCRCPVSRATLEARAEEPHSAPVALCPAERALANATMVLSAHVEVDSRKRAPTHAPCSSACTRIAQTKQGFAVDRPRRARVCSPHG